MSEVKTNDILRRLERVIESRTDARPQVKLLDLPSYSTDGVTIFLPAKERTFREREQNEMMLAFFAAHEADHVYELDEYFGDEASGMREAGTNLFTEFVTRNFSECTENPALASWLANIVDDCRIDTRRCDELPGVKRFFDGSLQSAAAYLRPSTRHLKPLDAFREQLFQQAYLGRTLDPVRDEYRPLLEEIVSDVHSARSIFDDAQVVTTIYEKIKRHFDITQPISNLPRLPWHRSHGSGQGSPQPGTPQQPTPGGEGNTPQKKPDDIKPREGRDPREQRPEEMADPNEDAKKEKKDGGKEDDNSDEKRGEKDDPAARERLYDRLEGKHQVTILRPDDTSSFKNGGLEDVAKLKEKHGHIIQATKQAFRRLAARNYGRQFDFSGDELDIERYLETDIEARATGIRSPTKAFLRDRQSNPLAAWAVLADASMSTYEHGILDHIRAALLVQGEALADTPYPFGLYSFSGELKIIKDFPERYSSTVAARIACMSPRGSGTSLAPCLATVGDLLRRQPERPRGITIITDGEANQESGGYANAIEYAQAVITGLSADRIFPFVIVIGERFEGYAKRLTQGIGEGGYCVIAEDELDRLPGELIRLFTTYGIAG